MKSKNQLLKELKLELPTKPLLRIFLRDCETLRDIKQSICWDLNFASTIEKQLDNGKSFQWYLGEMYWKTKYDVKQLKETCYYIAKKLDYEIEHNDGGFHYIGKISG
jgi:hypothetical protein